MVYLKWRLLSILRHMTSSFNSKDLKDLLSFMVCRDCDFKSYRMLTRKVPLHPNGLRFKKGQRPGLNRVNPFFTQRLTSRFYSV